MCVPKIINFEFVIGCFEESSVNTLTKKSYQMQFPSVGRCQEVCLATNYSVFGVQVTLSVCQLVFTNNNVIFDHVKRGKSFAHIDCEIKREKRLE